MNILLKAKRLTRVVSYVFFGTVIGFALGFAKLAYAEVTDLAGAPPHHLSDISCKTKRYLHSG